MIEPKITRKKILQAVAECDRYIAIESRRSADLRPAHIAATLAHYVAHRAKLVSMLPDARWVA